MHKDTFPKTQELGGATFNLRLMNEGDRETIYGLAQTLPEADLLFMRRDITQMDAVDEWISDIKKDKAITVLVEDNDRIVAYGTLYFNQLFWSRHLGELRVLVSSAYRNRGLGSLVVRELLFFAKDLKLDKVLTYIAVGDKGAQRVMEDLGFNPEAILTDWVKTRDERTQDLVIMAQSLNDVEW